MQKWKDTFGQRYNLLQGNEEFLASWLDDALSSYPKFLPRRWPKRAGGETQRDSWYVIAENRRQLRQLRDELQAFVGPSYSSFRGLLHEWDMSDSCEKRLSEIFGQKAFRIDFPSERSAEIAQQIKLLIALKKGQPKQTLVSWRLPEQALHDFEMALLEDNSERAKELLHQIRANELFSGTNLIFLEVIYYSNFGLWDKILQHSELDSVLSVARPRRVTESLLQALYYTYLSPLLLDEKFEQARQTFESDLQKPFERLFRRLENIREPESLICFSLFSQEGRNIPESRFEVIQEKLEQFEEPQWLDLFLRLRQVGKERGVEPSDEGEEDKAREIFEKASSLIEEEEHREAFELLRVLPLSAKVVQKILFCAALEGEPSVNSDVYDLLQLWMEEKGNALSSVHIRRWKQIVNNRKEEPRSWLDWATRLQNEPDWSEAQDVAGRICETWHPDQSNTTPQQVENFALALENLSGLTVTRHILCSLVRSFLEGRPTRLWLPVYCRLIELLVTQVSLTLDELDALHDVSRHLFQSGPEDKQYEQALEWLSLFLEQSDSVAYARWGINLIDPLSFYHSPVPTSRIQFLDTLLRLCRKVERYLKPFELRQTLEYARSLGGSVENESSWFILQPNEAVSTSNTAEAELGLEELLSKLKNLSVGVYTLQEDAAERFRNFVHLHNPALNVKLNHDKANSTALKTLCQSVDFLIVAWNCAKHAATDAIKRYTTLPEDRIVRVRGKGSSAMIQALYAFLKDLHSSPQAQGVFQ